MKNELKPRKRFANREEEKIQLKVKCWKLEEIQNEQTTIRGVSMKRRKKKQAKRMKKTHDWMEDFNPAN